MSSTVTFTVTCDAPEGCTATYTHGIGGDVVPDGWTHVPGRDNRRYYMSRKPRDYCPEHTPDGAQ